MQNFGKPPGNPYEDLLGVPLNDPLDPFTNDAFDAMLNALTRGAHTFDQQDFLYMDGLGSFLGDAEVSIEDNRPTPIRPGPDDLGRKLDRLEETIETSPAEAGFIEPEIHMPQQNSPVISEKGTDDTPPLPYYLENPQQTAPVHTPPHRQGGRIGRRGGRELKSSQPGQSDKKYCPIEDDYVSQDFCEDKDCKYYVKDSDSETAWHCTYHDDEES